MLLRDLYEASAKRTVAVMPGGFHPFHPGHKSLYDWAVKTFGQGNVYVAATNDTAARPFPFDVKKKLAGMAGVPESNFIQVKSPFNAMSYQDIVDDNTALVFVRSEKDKAEHPKPDQTKKNGEPGYLRTYTGKDLNSSNEMGYMAYGPTINFDFSGMQIKSASELRATWPNMSDEDKHKAAALMYGNGHDEAVQLLDKALGGSDAPVEDIDENWKGIAAGIALLTGIWGVSDNMAQTAYENSPQLQKLISLHQQAEANGNDDYADKLEMRIGNHKTRIDIGKGEVMGDDGKPITVKEDEELDENPLVRFAIQKGAGALARKGPNIAATAGAAAAGAATSLKKILAQPGKSNHTVGSARSPGASGYTKPGDEENGLDALAASKKNRNKQIKKESDVVVDKSSLVPYIKNLIMDYLDKEQDVEKLSKLLKMMVGREIKARGGKRYTITHEDISLALTK